jgi:hypothetical protein
MSRSLYYEFTAPAATTARALETFLRDVERLAKSLGFAPTTVLNVLFDNPARRDFSRHLGGSFAIEDERLKGVALPAAGQVRDHNPVSGTCRLVPERGVVLVVTDEGGRETCFGFFQFPEAIADVHGRTITQSGLGNTWSYRDFVNTPDQRYRDIVGRFVPAGYAKNVKDEYA